MPALRWITEAGYEQGGGKGMTGNIKNVAGGVIAFIAAITMTPLVAQDYPSKPIRIITTEAGGGTDFVARIVAQGLTSSFGQQMVVENRPSGVIPGQVASQAPPDGYTLLITSGSLWLGPLLRKTPYDPLKDFAPVSLLVNYPSVLVVHPSLPVQNVKDLVALARAKPGALNYGTPTLGTPTHLAAELFKAMAKVDIVSVVYKGTGPAVNALLGGHVQLMFGAPSSIAAHVKSGRLRALAVTSTKPSALVPGLPTVSATLPGYEMGAETAMLAPRNTPPAIVARVNREVAALLRRPDVVERLTGGGVEPVGSTPEELGHTMRTATERLGKLISEAGIRID